MAFPVRDSQMTEEEAYILAYTMAGAQWGRKPGTHAAIEFYNYLLEHTGYFAICGARGCIRSCNAVLEKSGRIEETFHNPYFKEQRWSLPLHPEEPGKGVNPYREE